MGLPVKADQGLQFDRKDMGKADTLRYNVSTYVVEEQYDRAIHEMKEFLKKDSEFPRFKEKSERYVNHAIDLVNAIRAKRKFPGAAYLTMAKQQELNEKFREHFHELQQVLKRIEKTHIDLKLEDIRSTVWVIRSVSYAIGAIVFVAFLMEASNGLGMTTVLVVDDSVHQLVSWIFQKIGM